MERLSRLIFPALGLLLLTACDQDPFNLACHDIGKTGYTLCQWEDDKTYYLESTDQRQKDGGGVIDGIVRRIAWNDKFIVVYRQALVRTPGTDGWMVIDLSTHKIDGPIEDSAEALRFPYLKPVDAADVWQSAR